MRALFRNSIKTLLVATAIGTSSGGWPLAPADCEDPAQVRATSANSIAGFSQASLDQQGNLVVTLDQNANGRVDRIYRFGLLQSRQRRQALERWSGREIELTVRTWEVGDRKVHQFLPALAARSFVVASENHRCLEEFLRSQAISEETVYLRTAISVHRPGALESSSHEATLDEFRERALFLADKHSTGVGKIAEQASPDFEPLWCMAGGEGATGCSIDFGGIGAFSAGGCSVSGCEAPSYACCGASFGSYCVCREPADDGAGSDSGGDLGGGSDGGTAGPDIGSGDDSSECQENDPPSHCEDAEGEKEEIDP
jgi:hypothetical protein